MARLSKNEKYGLLALGAAALAGGVALIVHSMNSSAAAAQQGQQGGQQGNSGGAGQASFVAGHTYQVNMTVPYPITTPPTVADVQAGLDAIAPGSFYVKSVDAVQPEGVAISADCLKDVNVPFPSLSLGVPEASVSVHDMGTTNFNARHAVHV